MSTALGDQLVWLLVLALPIASVSWTVTHEDVFRGPRDYCAKRSTDCQSLLGRKFFFLFTCEYCFSHYVTLAFLVPTDFRLLLPDWRGAVIAFFALVAVANVYMSAYSRLRVEIRGERVEIEARQKSLEVIERAPDGPLSRSESGR
jgi:hypothetical protein